MYLCTDRVSLVPRPPSFCSSVCIQHNTRKQHSGMCIMMNTNWRTKMGGPGTKGYRQSLKHWGCERVCAIADWVYVQWKWIVGHKFEERVVGNRLLHWCENKHLYVNCNKENIVPSSPHALVTCSVVKYGLSYTEGNHSCVIWDNPISSKHN